MDYTSSTTKVASTPFSINDILTAPPPTNLINLQSKENHKRKSFETFDNKLKTIFFDSNNNTNNKSGEEYRQEQMDLTHLHPSLRRNSLDCFIITNGNQQSASNENGGKVYGNECFKYRSESPLDMRNMRFHGGNDSG